MGEQQPAGSPIRVSDEERQAVVDVLREQTSAGRLTLAEFEERLDEVYRSKTDVELRQALRELPVQPPVPLAKPGAASAPDTVTDEELRGRYRRRVRNDFGGFIVPNFVCNLIWVLADGGYWWPGWVLVGTGATLLTTVIRGYDPEKERNELLEERRKRAIGEIEYKFEARFKRD